MGIEQCVQIDAVGEFAREVIFLDGGFSLDLGKAILRQNRSNPPYAGCLD